MKFKAMTAVAALLLSVPAMTLADPDEDALVVNGETEYVTETSAPAHLSDVLDTIYSGWRFREDETQALQMDDFDNPGMVFADLGLDQWNKVEGEAEKSCASCHGTPEESMKGVRAVYPKWNEAAQEVRTLAMQVNDCRETNMKAVGEKRRDLIQEQQTVAEEVRAAQ